MYEPTTNIPATKWKRIGSILLPSTAHLRRCCYVAILNNVEEDIANMGKNVRCPTCGTNSHSQKMSENVGEVGECKIKTTTNSSPPLDRLHQCCINTIYENAFKNKQNKIHNPYEDVDCHYQPCKMVEDLKRKKKKKKKKKFEKEMSEGFEEPSLKTSYHELFEIAMEGVGYGEDDSEYDLINLHATRKKNV